MFGFFKNKTKDMDLSRDFVNLTFATGKAVCPSISEAVKMKTDFPINDDTSFEISVAILGTSLAMLKGYTQVMTSERGLRIEEFCKNSLENDYGLPFEAIKNLKSDLNEYQSSFKNSMLKKENPFAEISSIMLCRCLGSQSKMLCLPDSDIISPFILQLVGDTMTMIVMRTLEFWKRK